MAAHDDVLTAYRWPVDVFAEPGRCIVAEAGTFRCRVIGVAARTAHPVG